MAGELERKGHPRLRRGAPRVAVYLATIFCLIVVNFFLPRLMPGDPIDALAAQSSSNFTFGEQSRVNFEKYYGLDKPLPQQFGHYLNQLAHGDLGRSIGTNQPVRNELFRRLRWTILLVGTSLAVATLLGLVAGIHSGWKRGRGADRFFLTTLLAVREFPAFLLGSLLLFLFAVKLDVLPLSGAETLAKPLAHPGLGERLVDLGQHLLLPATVLTTGLMAGSFLLMRASMVSELGADHLLLGRAKGLRERRLKYRYAARNALLPVLSLTALQLGFAVSG
ncbi:MAG: ABC transporter permease, partial [Acidimicrobiales bacterium]